MMLQSVTLDIFASTLTKMFGLLFDSICNPHFGAHPVRAVARADSPDSLFVTREV